MNVFFLFQDPIDGTLLHLIVTFLISPGLWQFFLSLSLITWTVLRSKSQSGLAWCFSHGEMGAMGFRNEDQPQEGSFPLVTWYQGLHHIHMTLQNGVNLRHLLTEVLAKSVRCRITVLPFLYSIIWERAIMSSPSARGGVGIKCHCLDKGKSPYTILNSPISRWFVKEDFLIPL